MNKVILMGRLTRKPEISWNEEDLCIARFTLAVDRRFKREGQQDADFIGCVAFGKNAEFADKYLNQGTKIALEGRIQTGSYTNRDGVKVYTTEVVVEEQEFAESKAVSDSHVNRSASQPAAPDMADSSAEGFMNIPDEIGGELPF
mgnify:CR=1 FL=1